jgi:hypothetical protein
MEFDNPQLQHAYESCTKALEDRWQENPDPPPVLNVYAITFTSDENTAKRVLKYIGELPTTDRSYRFYPAVGIYAKTKREVES